MALIGYLRTNGTLPCPDSTTGVATGTAPATCTTAVQAYGVLPWQTLGIPRDATQDGWGNLFTYRVANFNTATQITPFTTSPPLHRNSNQNWTIKTGAGAFDIVSLSDATVSPGYQSLRIESGGGTPESHIAVAVILSHGKNGFGAKTVKVANRIPTTGAGVDEITNATSTTSTFIRRPVTSNYDDLVNYMTPQDLLQPLITEGTLKTCCGYCPSSSSSSGYTATCTPSGTLSCTGGGSDLPSCSTSGVISCTTGNPHCTGSGTPTCTTTTSTSSCIGCSATGIPIGASTATCI